MAEREIVSHKIHECVHSTTTSSIYLIQETTRMHTNPNQFLRFVNDDENSVSFVHFYFCLVRFYSVLSAWSCVPAATILLQCKLVVNCAVQFVNLDVEHFQISLRSD